MGLRGVMGYKRGVGESFDRWGNDVGFGGVEVAAARIYAEGPGGEPG